jgi:hypothetical protein
LNKATICRNTKFLKSPINEKDKIRQNITTTSIKFAKVKGFLVINTSITTSIERRINVIMRAGIGCLMANV